MSLGLFGGESGAAEETRTPDPIITNDVLYQLSYSGTFWSRPTIALLFPSQPRKATGFSGQSAVNMAAQDRILRQPRPGGWQDCL